jgi:hypothetical protein
LDNARLSASVLADTKTMMSTILAGLSSVELRDCMKFEEEGSLYCSFKDVSRQGSQHVESLSVIFSGSQNEGVSYCDNEHNPFQVESGGLNRRIVTLKKFSLYGNTPEHLL